MLNGISPLAVAATAEFAAPEGFAFVVNDEGQFLSDSDGAYIVTEVQ